jgi:hypothetical protein
LAATLAESWRSRFFETVVSEEIASELKASSLDARLKDWTRVLTAAVVATCESQGWRVAARRHRLDRMPETREEYLGIDAMAFEASAAHWLFPIAAIELENSRRDDRIAYSLWKVLNIRAPLAVAFCYRPSADVGAVLVRHLAQTVVQSMSLDRRVGLTSETLVTVGYRNQAETFPYGFFKWWRLNVNTGEFEQF